MANDNVVKLLYKDKMCIEPEGDQDTAGAIAVLEVNESIGKSILTFTPDAGLIDKRTSQRQANSICKTGFLLEGGKRVGIGCELVVSSNEVISDRLLQAGYHYK